ncbi:RDD family protein [Streptomyces cinnamoneus]|uniref:RDD family protein n=1 Tax=Streptomyces cinnamoneus TaxID=53446 RepID=UPI0033E8041B
MIDPQYHQAPQQPHAPQPPYQHPYQEPYQQAQPYQQGHPYQQPQAHQHPYAQPPAYQQHFPQPPAVPREVGDLRRITFAGIDGAITLFGGFGLAVRLSEGKGTGAYWTYAAICFFAISFIHHVLGAVLFRTTVGKFLLMTRVVRADDAGRPRFWQAVRRWLLGLTWLPMQPIWSIFGDDGEPYEDGCGLRYVCSRDLRR